MKPIKITININSTTLLVDPCTHSQFHPDYSRNLSYSTILYSQLYLSMYELKIVSYFACFAVDGYYHAGRGARELLCDRLDMNKSTYQKSMNRLQELKVFKRLNNGSGSQYVYYQLDANLQAIIQNEGKVSIVFEQKGKK